MGHISSVFDIYWCPWHGKLHKYSEIYRGAKYIGDYASLIHALTLSYSNYLCLVVVI